MLHSQLDTSLVFKYILFLFSSAGINTIGQRRYMLPEILWLDSRETIIRGTGV